MNKHTQGPWKVETDDWSVYVVDKSRLQRVADIPLVVGGRKETMQNARLVSAAPSLLDALKTCLPLIEADVEASHLLDGFHRKENRQDEMLRYVRSVVKQAEGKRFE